ncbi:MAG: serine acetyltransferase [Spartobacteria bacterium]
MFQNIRADISRKINGYGVRPEDQTLFRKRITPLLEFGTFAVIVYRFGFWAYSIKIPVIRQLLIAAYLIIDVVCMIVTGIKIQRESIIGPGLVIHCFSCIHVLVKLMGHSCTINQGVSLANIRGSGRPTIGNNVYFGAGCRVLGNVVIGDNVVVCANSLVMSDVPSGCTVLGVPARIISRESTSPYLKTPIAPTSSPETTKVD